MSGLEDIKKDSKIEIETIEEAIPNAIKEMQNQEFEKQRHNEVLEFEKYKKMEKSHDALDKMRNELTLQKQLNNIHSDVLTNRSRSSKSEGNILKVAKKNGEGIKSIDGKFNKTIYSLYAIFLILGICIGMLDEVWKPFLSDLLSFAKTASNIIR